MKAVRNISGSRTPMIGRRGTSTILAALAKAETASGSQPVPWTIAVPIYVDSWMDGLLIGIVLAVSVHAGAIMTLATTIEMGFLGITFGALLKPCGGKRWVLAALAPLILVAGGVAGTLSASTLQDHPALFNGIVAFGASALLFLVTHELLKEARENEGEEEDWTLSSWLFVGFFFIIISERIFPDAS